MINKLAPWGNLKYRISKSIRYSKVLGLKLAALIKSPTSL
jgi:hypothetical protein